MEALSKCPVVQEYPVHWGEMDAAKHVNNLIYLRWCESGRLAYFERIGISVDFDGDLAGPILGWQDCKYIFPITYPDTAIVGARCVEILEDRFIMECAVFSQKHQRIAAISKQHIIPYSYADLRKVPLPEAWRKEIEVLQNQ